MDAVGIWLIILIVLPFLLFLFRILLMAWKSALLSRKIKNLSSEIEARQGQVSTVSGSVDSNSITSSDTPSTSQQTTDATIKIDLPPTYDEVMKTYLDAKAAAAASTEVNAGPTPEVSSCSTTEIDIEELPPPQYSNIQS